MDSLLANLNVFQILSLGSIGLGFFLGVLSYRLLTQEQRVEKPRPALIRSIYAYMVFALALVVLGIVGQTVNSKPSNTATSEDLTVLTDVFAKRRTEYAQDRKADKFKQGILSSSSNETFEVSLETGECKTFLAMLLPSHQLELRHSIQGLGKDEVRIDISSGLNFQTGDICAGSSPAVVALTLSVKDGASPYIVETYFSIQRLYGPLGTQTNTAIVDASQLTRVRPRNYESNQEFFVHVFSDAANRGRASRALAILQENGFDTRPHIEEGANMAGWRQNGNGIVAGDGEGTEGKAVEIRRLLREILDPERLEIYSNGENPDLTSMGGKTLAVFLSGE